MGPESGSTSDRGGRRARFHDPELASRPEAPRLGEEETRHLSGALRLGPGAEVEVFDGAGRFVRARVTATGRRETRLEALEALREERPPERPLTLFVAAPKGERFDWLVEKATELGVWALVPLRTRRSVVEPGSGKLDRLRRRVIEACKQCGRSRAMALEEPSTWAEMLRRGEVWVGGRWIAHPGDPDADADSEADSEPTRVSGPNRSGPAAVAIGPEGGFADDEIAEARAAGWTLWDFGGPVLRVETAALAAAALASLRGPGTPPG